MPNDTKINRYPDLNEAKDAAAWLHSLGYDDVYVCGENEFIDSNAGFAPDAKFVVIATSKPLEKFQDADLPGGD